MSAHASAFPATREPPHFSLAWFAGADLRVLRRAPSEHTFYNALGTTVLLLAAANGFAACLAVGYMLQIPPGHLWWLGISWAAIVACGVERLVLQLPTSKKRLVPLVLVPRIALSLFLAVQLGEPLVLRANQGEINNALSVAKTTETEAAVTKAAEFYEPKILADQRKIDRINASMATLASHAEENRFLSECETNTPSCSVTGKPTCKAFCHHFARLAIEAKAKLAAREPESRSRVGVLEAEIKNLERAQKSQERSRGKGIGQNGGLLAREEALETLESAHPVVRNEVWFLRFLFLSLDLLPLSAKVLRLLSINSPYEEISAAARQHDSLDAHATQETVRVERDRLAEQARADIEVNREHIWLGATRRIDEVRDSSHTPPNRDSHARRSAKPVSAPSLGEFAERMQPHESRPVPVPPALRRGGLVGLALVGTVTVAASVWAGLFQQPVAGMWLVLTTFGFVTMLALYTRGFRAASAWGLRAIFATLLAGLTLPLLIAGMNL